MATHIEKMRVDLATAVTRAERAEATASELERRVEDLRTELARAHSDADYLCGELATLRAKADAAEQAD